METNFFTMTETEVSSFVTKFRDLLHNGQRASLVMDCDNGEARVTLEMFLQPGRHQRQSRAEHEAHRYPPQHVRHPPHLPRDTAASHPYQPPSGRAGPSRLRRRARRQAAARQAQVPLYKPPPADRRADHHPRPADRHGQHHPPHQDNRRAGHHPRHANHHPPADRHVGYHHPIPDRRAGHHPPPADRRAGHHPPPADGHAVHHPPPAERRAYDPHPPPAERRARHPPPPPAKRRAYHTPPPPAETRAHHHPPPPAETRAGPYPPPTESRVDYPPPPAPPQPVAEVAHHPNPLPEVLKDQVSLTFSPSSYSSVVSLKSLARPPDQPGSPGGWGALDPTRAEGDDDDWEDSEEDRADLGSFCFSPLEPPKHPPRDSPPSSPRRLFAPLQKKCPFSEIRKPVIHLKSLLSENIFRATQLRNSGEGCGRWVWKVCVERDFETKMIFDRTSFVGFTHIEVQSLLKTQAELDEEYESDEEYEEKES